jgi:hypothetical protein
LRRSLGLGFKFLQLKEYTVALRVKSLRSRLFAADTGIFQSCPLKKATYVSKVYILLDECGGWLPFSFPSAILLMKPRFEQSKFGDLLEKRREGRKVLAVLARVCQSMCSLSVGDFAFQIMSWWRLLLLPLRAP